VVTSKDYSTEYQYQHGKDKVWWFCPKITLPNIDTSGQEILIIIEIQTVYKGEQKGQGCTQEFSVGDTYIKLETFLRVKP
jgi:hypothetical protein